MYTSDISLIYVRLGKVMGERGIGAIELMRVIRPPEMTDEQLLCCFKCRCFGLDHCREDCGSAIQLLQICEAFGLDYDELTAEPDVKPSPAEIARQLAYYYCVATEQAPV